MIGLLFWLGCASKDAGEGTDGDSGLSGDSGLAGDTGGLPVADGCRAQPAAADRDRLLVLALPYDASGGQADAWAALTLTAAGDVVDAGARFTMGRGLLGQVAFSPDGSLGVAAQDDGSIGVFTVNDDLTVSVVEARFEPGFYAVAVTIDPSGEAAWVVDGNWVENGGGVYRVPLDCGTGAPGAPSLALPIKLPVGLHFLRRQLDRAVVVGWEAEGAADASAEVHLLDMAAGPSLLGSAEAFGDDEALLSASAVTADDRYALAADYSPWSGLPNRVAAVALDGDAPEPVQVIEIYDPVAILASPFDDLLLVSSGYGDAIESITYDPDAAEPFGVGRTVATSALPADGVVLTRGPLIGLTMIAENQGVRGLQFEGGGEAADLGMLYEGDGLEAIPGAIGVQP